MPNMAITACMPAGKTEPCVAFMPSVRVSSKMRAAAEMGLAVIACCEAITAMPSGLSERTCEDYTQSNAAQAGAYNDSYQYECQLQGHILYTF